MDVSQTTRVRRVMLHFADVAPTGARARRGARARNAQAERTKTAARVFSRGRANRGRRDATRGDGAASWRGLKGRGVTMVILPHEAFASAGVKPRKSFTEANSI